MGTQTRMNYTGQKLDDTGLLYYHARMYDPAVGRFVSPDSIVPASAGGGEQNSKLTVDFHESGFASSMAGENAQTLSKGFWFQLSGEDKQKTKAPWGPINPQALSRYSYTLNNPLHYTDPTGHFLFEVLWAGPIPIGVRVALSAEDLRHIVEIFDGAEGSGAQDKLSEKLAEWINEVCGGRCPKELVGALAAALVELGPQFLKAIADHNSHIEYLPAYLFPGGIPFPIVIAEGSDPPKDWRNIKWATWWIPKPKGPPGCPPTISSCNPYYTQPPCSVDCGAPVNGRGCYHNDCTGDPGP